MSPPNANAPIGHGTLTAFQASFLILNTAIGSGIFGLPWAIGEAGMAIGAVIIVFVALLNLFAMFILINCGMRAKTYNFEDLSRLALGKFGTSMLQFAIVVNGIGCCISYLLIIGDTMTPVMLAIFGPDTLLLSRNTVITGFAIIVIFPLLFFRTIAPLSKPSALSIICIPIIMVFVAVRGLEHQQKRHPEIHWVGKGLFSAMGMIAFAFGSTQTTFQSFVSLKHPTLKQWNTTALLASTMMLVIYLSFSFIGYLSFGDIVQTNILNNFPMDDPWANFARILMAISILLTYPMQFYPLRDLVATKFNLCLGQSTLKSAKVHLMSIVFFIGTLGVSLRVNDLGLVYQLVGTCSATLLSFLLPSGIYFGLYCNWSHIRRLYNYSRIEHGEEDPINAQANPDSDVENIIAVPEDIPSEGKYTFISLCMFAFGVVVFVIGTYVALRNKFSPSHV